MGVMAEMLEQYNKGDITLEVLREAHTKRYDDMETYGIEARDKGWMSLKDAIPGETSEEKVKAFAVENDELGRVEQLILSIDQAFAKQKALRRTQAPATSEHGGQQPEGGRGFVGERVAKVETDLSSLSAKIRKSESFQKNFPDGRLPSMSTKFTGDYNFDMHMKDGLPMLKAFTITTPMPIDIVAQPYPMRTQPLDYVNIRTAPGSQIFYHTPNLPGTVGPASTHRAQVRTRGLPLNETNIEWDDIRLTKRSLGSWMPINYEDVNDNAAFAAVAAEQLMIDIRLLMVQQMLQGRNTGDEWQGLSGALTTTSGLGQNTAPVPMPAGTAPNYTNTEAIHPVQALVNAMVQIWQRGMFPTAIFLGATDYVKINYQQRLERYLQTDYRNFPMGDVQGVPLVLTDQLPANEIIIADLSPQNAEIVLGQELQIGMSDDYRFANNQRAIRVVTYGNLAIYRPLAFWKLTATNQLTIIRPGI